MNIRIWKAVAWNPIATVYIYIYQLYFYYLYINSLFHLLYLYFRSHKENKMLLIIEKNLKKNFKMLMRLEK